jgi:hypothetical protein
MHDMPFDPNDPIVQFIRARLNEDEQRVLSLGPAKLGWGTYRNPDGSMSYTSPVASTSSDEGEWVTAGEVTHPDQVTVVFDPERELREIAAKRALLDWHDQGDPHFIYSGYTYVVQVWKCLTRSYADHPDYRDEWWA